MEPDKNSHSIEHKIDEESKSKLKKWVEDYTVTFCTERLIPIIKASLK